MSQKRTYEIINLLEHCTAWMDNLKEVLEELGKLNYKCPDCKWTFDGDISKLYVILKHRKSHD